MNKQYKITESESSVLVSLSANKVNLNEKDFHIDILKDYKNNVYSVAVNNKIYQIQVKESSKGIMKILCDGFEYNFSYTTPLEEQLQKFMLAKEGAGAKKSIIKSPMPGLIVKINFSIGDKVSKGDKVIIIEAMKMENALVSPITGIVKEIYVTEGIAVEKDSKLIDIEAE